MSDDGIKRMDAKEFREGGFLHEVNRLCLHPLGLALEVVVNDDGSETLGGVWDYRDDPEGMVFGPGCIDPAKIAAVDAERARHEPFRLALFGTVVQPPDSGHPESTTPQEASS